MENKDTGFLGTAITDRELMKQQQEGEIFLTPEQLAAKLQTSEKALRQMRWRARTGRGRNHYPYYQWGRKVLYPLSLFMSEGRKALNHGF